MEIAMTKTAIRKSPVHVGIHVGWRSAAVVAFAITAYVVVGCSADPDQRTSAAATTAEAPSKSALEGTWRTSSVSLRDTEATLRRQGFGRFVKDYRANAPFSTDTVLELSIENGQWNLYGESEGEPAEPIDYDATYKIDGDTVTFDHSDGSNTHRWTVDGDTLRLEFVKGTMPTYEGIPDEVFQRALYMTEPFTRQD
jgi:hypothetical protein